MVGRYASAVRQYRAVRPAGSGDLNPVIPDDVFDGHVSADSLEVVADGADLGAVEVPVLDLGDLALADTDSLG